jgi:hypothetical protein
VTTAGLHRAAVLVAWTGALACGRPPDASSVRLLDAQGTVEAERQGRWRVARAGERLMPDEALRTGEASQARLRFPDGARLRLQERTLIRLGRGVGTSLLFHVELGQLEVEAEAGTTLVTGHGPAQLAPGTRLRIRIDGARTRYEVRVGSASFESASSPMKLVAGDGLALALGSAEVERYRAEFGAPEIEIVPLPVEDRKTARRTTASNPASRTSGGSSEPSAPRPDRGAEIESDPSPPPGESVARASAAADVTVPLGESAAIHSLKTPVLVRLKLEAGCVEPAVEVMARARKRLRPEDGNVLLSLPPGTHRYRSRCGGKPGPTGMLTVRRDGSTRRLPGSAPSNAIDADGHRYIIHYQNRLPALTLLWPDPPASDHYTLHLQQRKDVRRYELKTAEHRLPAGVLAEGEHSFWFTTADGKPSPTTQVAIRFDNGATAAQILAPADGNDPAGDSVEVAGVALVGSTVAVGTTALPTDEQGRFHGRVPTPAPDARTLAIRLHHPSSGIHYYIRRLR